MGVERLLCASPSSPPDPEPDYRQPPWKGLPHGTLPGIVALELVLAQTEKVAVYIARLMAYPSWFAFDLMTTAARGHADLDFDPMVFGHHRRGQQEEISPELLRSGVEFSDGAKVTNVGGFHHGDDPPPDLRSLSAFVSTSRVWDQIVTSAEAVAESLVTGSC